MRFHHTPLNSLVIAVAVWLAAWTLRPMFTDADYLLVLPLVLGTAAVVGVLGALLRLPRTATLAIQTLGMAAALVWLGFRYATMPPQQGEPWYEPLLLLGRAGTAAVRNSTTPLPDEPGLLWLLLCILGLVVVSTELLVNVLEQPAWAAAPLAVVYGVGALTLSQEMDWKSFAALALGYALVLVTSTRLAGAQRSRSAGGAATGLVVASATLLVALVLAPALTDPVPLGPKQPWLQAGRSAPIELSDPKVALSENLRRPAEQEVLRYRTTSQTPVYLRTVALTRLSTSGAELTGMQLSTTGLSGAYTFPGRDVETTVSMSMPSEYLPAPFAVDRFSADGEWAHDKDTMSIVATGSARTEQTLGLEYEVSSTVPEPERSELEAATAGVDPSGKDTLSVPEGLDDEVVALTDSVTASATSDGEKALAIQSFLRSEQFTYDVQAPDTAGMDKISDFLLRDNSGYCIHFAAGMITMARLQGIPARMAIGFTPGTRDGEEWVVTTHNMHSWPELYFEGLGWVPFEPTKSIAAPPAYTDADVADVPSPSPSASPDETAAPSPPPSTAPEPTEEPTVSPTPSPDTAAGVPLIGWLLLGVAVLLAVPATLRSIIRRWRLRGGQDPQRAADAAWREVRALFIDAGLAWSHASPVLACTALEDQLEPTVATRLASVARTVERARYARDGADTSHLAAAVGDFRGDLVRSQGGRRRFRALLLPPSLVSRRMRSPGELS